MQSVGQSSCGSSEVQLVGRLPARVVELLQSSAVGKPCQDHRLCQDSLSLGMPLPLPPTTSSDAGPPLGPQGLLQGFALERDFLQQSACESSATSVGRSVGRCSACLGQVGQHAQSVGCGSACLDQTAQLAQSVKHGSGSESFRVQRDLQEKPCKRSRFISLSNLLRQSNQAQLLRVP